MTNYCACLFLVLVHCLVYGQDRQNFQKLLEQGEKAYHENRYEEALAYFNEYLQHHPNAADAYRMRAATREQLKDLTGAHIDYSLSLELKPDNPEALLSRGTIRLQLERYAEAKEDFLKLLTIPKGETNTIFYQTSPGAGGTNPIFTAQSGIHPQVFNYLGLAELKLKNFKQAITWFDSAIHLQPRAADYYVNRGMAKEAINTADAKSDYQAALQLNPNHTLALHNLSVLKRKTGDPSQAKDLEEAIESDSSMLYPYLERAYQRLEGGYYKGALEDYDKAISIEKSDPEIWLNRGLVKEKLNDLKGAYADYTQAIALKENFSKAWLNRGNVLQRLSRYKEAVEDYTIALTFQPNYASALYNRAVAKERLKRYSEACQDLLQAEQLGVKPEPRLKAKVCKE
jgi:tetratricopeptide (TPR) repeat protein